MAGNITNGFVTISPNFMLPEVVTQYSQPSGAFHLVAGGKIVPRLGNQDLAVYAKRMNLKTAHIATQNRPQQVPSCSIETELASIATYNFFARAIYDDDEVAFSNIWGFSLVEALRLAMQQGIFNGLRNALLYGVNSQNAGEGLVNTPGALNVPLPADSQGHATIQTYLPGEMAQLLSQYVVQMKIRMNQMGQPARVVITAPQRVIGQWQYAIVPLTSYQLPGSGVASTGQVAQNVIGWSGDTIEFAYDDTLIGKGTGGTDLIIFSIPELKVPKPIPSVEQNTNVFASLTPNLRATSLQLASSAAPIERTMPQPDDALAMLLRMRATPGWGLRPEGLFMVSALYA